MFTLDDIEQEIRKIEARHSGSRLYFRALLDKLRSRLPHWRVSIKGGTAYTYVHATTAAEAIELAKDILLTTDTEAEPAGLESEPPPPV